MRPIQLRRNGYIFVKKPGPLLAFLFCLFGFMVPPSLSYAQVTLDSLADMDFGAVDFAVSYSGSIQLGTDGNVAVTGSGLVRTSNGAAGRVRVTLPDSGDVEVKCATSGILAAASATSLTISNTEIAINTGQVFGAATACQGVGAGDAVVETIDLDALSDPVILIGGEISIPGTITLPPGRVYSTSGSGTPIRLSVVIP